MRTAWPLAIVLAVAPARADVAVDWARGLVTAEGVGIADRHAPNPAVARGTSRRGAEDAARAQLAKGLGTLPVAGGGTVAAKAKAGDVQARIERAVAQAIAVAAQPETDGAWRVTMAVPIEALRLALEAGPRGVPAAGDVDPPVVVVDGVKGKPAIGWTVGGHHAATIWVKEVPAWAKDAPHAAAASAKDGAIELAGTTGGDATLYVIAQP
jgi:hypothetical protein